MKPPKKAYQEKISKTQKNSSHLENHIIEFDDKIVHHMLLYERGKVSPEIFDGRISLLEGVKRNLEETLGRK